MDQIGNQGSRNHQDAELTAPGIPQTMVLGVRNVLAETPRTGNARSWSKVTSPRSPQYSISRITESPPRRSVNR